MSARILDGKLVSGLLREELKRRVESLASKGVTPRLHVLAASQDPASQAYVRMKRKRAEDAGIETVAREVFDETTLAEVLDTIGQWNADPAVHGVLIQHPLPSHLDESAALTALGPEKDVDGITPQSLGRLAAGLPGFRCATPLGIVRLIDHFEVPIEGKRAVVIGRSVILGKPMALMLLERNATVTIAHSKTNDLPDLCRNADILVAAAGRPEMVRGDWILPGAVVVDAGYSRVEGREGEVGDVHFESARERASWISPVPGGVGPMTVASLLGNVVSAAEAAAA